MNPVEAEKKQKEILRAFSNSKRLRLALDLSDLVNKLHKAGKKAERKESK